jgi:hypothetical protein
MYELPMELVIMGYGKIGSSPVKQWSLQYEHLVMVDPLQMELVHIHGDKHLIDDRLMFEQLRVVILDRLIDYVAMEHGQVGPLVVLQ